jgi:hypothetical protein
MIQYVKKVIIPYVECIRARFEEDTPALVIVDNFKGQVVSSVTDLLESNTIHVCLLPPTSSNPWTYQLTSLLKTHFEDRNCLTNYLMSVTSNRQTCSQSAYTCTCRSAGLEGCEYLNVTFINGYKFWQILANLQ